MSADWPRIWVVDDSPAIRETVAVVLGGVYDVHATTVDDCRSDPSQLRDADLLILGDTAVDLESLSSLAAGPPILWLLGPDCTAAPTGSPSAALPRHFSPVELRARVQTLLSTPPTRRAPAGSIDHPVFPTDVVGLARRAAETHFPALICGEPGTGKARLARAIHLLRRDGRFVALSANQCTRTALQDAARIAAGNLTVFVSDIDALPVDGQHVVRELLECAGFASDAGWHGVRLICATSQSLEELARGARLDRELFYRLSVLPITIPPLRERTEDIPALATYVARRLTEALSTDQVTFTPRAMERLRRYLWFGNLAEFETVLTRSIALTSPRSIDTDDLLFGYGHISPRPRTTARPRPERVPSEPAAAQAIDLIINELAHEFKNPMVTIKTVAQHLERLLGDEKGREQVTRLTGEAVDRMDRALDNLLQFTSFRTPAPQETALNTLLAPSLTDLAPLLSERHVLLDYRPVEAFPVFVDGPQVAYAFDNLLRAIARDLPEGHTLAVRPGEEGSVVRVEWTGGNQLATKLAEFLDHRDNGHGTLPIGMVFAKTLIERNGGRLDIQSGTDRSVVTVWLPSRGEASRGHGKASSPSR